MISDGHYLIIERHHWPSKSTTYFGGIVGRGIVRPRRKKIIIVCRCNQSGVSRLNSYVPFFSIFHCIFFFFFSSTIHQRTDMTKLVDIRRFSLVFNSLSERESKELIFLTFSLSRQPSSSAVGQLEVTVHRKIENFFLSLSLVVLMKMVAITIITYQCLCELVISLYRNFFLLV